MTLPLAPGFEWNDSTSIKWVNIRQIHVALRINFNDICVPLTFHHSPSSGQNSSLSNTLVFDQMTVQMLAC